MNITMNYTQRSLLHRRSLCSLSGGRSASTYANIRTYDGAAAAYGNASAAYGDAAAAYGDAAAVLVMPQ